MLLTLILVSYVNVTKLKTRAWSMKSRKENQQNLSQKTFLWVLVALQLCKEGSFPAERKKGQICSSF